MTITSATTPKRCPRCAYDPAVDKATPLEHATACRPFRDTSRLEYTAAPNCSDRTWHHSETWCDACKGVA